MTYQITSTAVADECEYRIIFLPQIHRNVIDSRLGETNIEEVAKSQFHIAKIILENSEVPIFSEQVDENIIASKIEGDLRLAGEKIKFIFPFGIPENFESLSIKQKEQLAFAGADFVLLFIHKIQVLYKVVENRSVSDAIFARINELMGELKPSDKIDSYSELMILVDDVREKAALNEIKKYFNLNPKEKSAFLIYGKNHNFRRHDDIFPGKCIKTPQSLNY